MNGDHTERIPQEGERRNEEEYGILERASAFARGVLKEVEALAGTTACKSVQLVRLRQRPSRPWRLYGRHHLVQRLGYRLQDT